MLIAIKAEKRLAVTLPTQATAWRLWGKETLLVFGLRFFSQPSYKCNLICKLYFHCFLNSLVRTAGWTADILENPSLLGCLSMHWLKSAIKYSSWWQIVPLDEHISARVTWLQIKKRKITQETPKTIREYTWVSLLYIEKMTQMKVVGWIYLLWWSDSGAEKWRCQFTGQSAFLILTYGHEVWVVTERMRSWMQWQKWVPSKGGWTPP